MVYKMRSENKMSQDEAIHVLTLAMKKGINYSMLDFKQGGIVETEVETVKERNFLAQHGFKEVIERR